MTTETTLTQALNCTGFSSTAESDQHPGLLGGCDSDLVRRRFASMGMRTRPCPLRTGRMSTIAMRRGANGRSTK